MADATRSTVENRGSDIPEHARSVSGTWNFRDIGGTPTPAGPVRHGIVFRSAVLSRIDPDGRSALERLRVADVFDLRGEREVLGDGSDRLPPSVTLHSTPFHPEGEEIPVHEAAEDASSPRGQMARVRDYYHAMPRMLPAQKAVAELLRTVADGQDAVLVHCAAGKDRTGWAIASLLTAAGADRDAVMSEYLLSNTSIESLRAWLQRQYGDSYQASDEVLGVDRSYLQTAWRSVEDEFGSFDGYLDAIGIGPDVVQRIRRRLVG
jgi:protein-tyrosine phosphatase